MTTTIVGVDIPKRARPILLAMFERHAESFAASATTATLAADRATLMRDEATARGFAMQIRETSRVELPASVRNYFTAAICEGDCPMLDAVDDGRWRDVRVLARVMQRVDRLTA